MGRGGDAGPGTMGFAVCTFVWVFVSIFLLAFSFDTLTPNTMALKMNDNTLFLDATTLYNGEPAESGRWFVGLGQQFLEFPRNLISVKFNGEEDADASSVQAKTHNGTTIIMGIAYQYGINRTPADVHALYMKFGLDYTAFLVKSVRQTVRDIIADHAIVDLWEQRAAISVKVKTAMDALFRDRHCYVANFQLLSLDIPRDIQDAIERTSVAFQKIGEAKFEKDAETVRAQTRRLVAEKTAEVTVLQAEGSAQAVLLAADAQAKSLNMTVGAELRAYNSVKATFGFNTSRLLSYIWLDNMIGIDGVAATFAIDQPTITEFTK